MRNLATVTASRKVGGGDRRSLSLGLLVTPWNVDDIELATGRLLRDKFFGWVVRDMVAVNNIIIPVAGAELEGIRALKAEVTLPGSRLCRAVLGHRQWKLGLVVVP